MNHNQSRSKAAKHNQSLPSLYSPHQTEARIYRLWEKAKAFEPISDKKPETRDQGLESKQHVPFTIVIPPPNVTGSLHIGHALNNTIQDILIRYHRMKGEPTLWLPGTDHAGIATQNVVEKELAKANKSRHDLGREKFILKVWDWVNQYGHIITDQLKKLGCSCDWSRERFTLDQGYSEAVNAVFKHYYNKGWVYQGERVINWCPRCQTALSDIELEYQEVEGKLWYLKYKLKTKNLKLKTDYIVVATTRPETMLGDTAVAVNPKDKRYEHLIGKTVILPLTERAIPIIADRLVDPKFGTGAVKVTPAHDPTDFEIGQRHHLKAIKVIDEKGRIISDLRPGTRNKYVGLKIAEARENIIKDLQSQNLLLKTQNHIHQVPHCYRCGKTAEQLMSKQWFVKMKELAKPAIEAVQKDEIKFVPERWKKVYLDWMANLKDWCISRQIWWGHRLPVWQAKRKTKNEKLKTDYYVGDNPPEGYKQVEDVLDTWFSSALWPIAVFLKKNGSNSNLKNQNAKLRKTIDIFGEDAVTEDLDYFYPTSILCTARDIIYLWVARMIFSGLELMGKKPFETVYIHPTLFNIEGKRMSKSLGTGVDPLGLIEKFGADALRFGLTYINTGVQDIRFDEKAILAGQKFANKVWNISRFIMMNLENSKLKTKNSKLQLKTKNDKEILIKLQELTKSTTANLEKFRFGQVAHDLYDFIWHDLADQYLEQSKEQLENPKLKENTQRILLKVLTTSLKLLHPIMPFFTEEIWQNLPQYPGKEKLLITAKWPEKL